MKPISQTKFGMKGNCFSACIASIFEIELNDAPDLMPNENIKGEEQDKILNEWLRKYNLKYIEVRFQNDKVEKFLLCVYHFIIGTSPRNKDIDHCVVGLGGKMIYDPHPDKTGVVGLLKYGVFISLDVSF
jgi:hypothetical protein